MKMEYQVIGQVLSSYLTLGIFPTLELAELFVQALKTQHIYAYIQNT